MKIISWEYKVSPLKTDNPSAEQIESGLNFYGRAGWEYAGMIDIFENNKFKKAVVLKRPIALTKLEGV